MKVNIFLLFLLLIVGGCFGSGSNKYELVYHFKNPSLGPVSGSRRFKIIIENKEIISAVDIKSGQIIATNKIPGIKLFKQALLGKNKKAIIKYNKDGLPIKVSNILHRGSYGGGYTVEIIKIEQK